MKHCKLLSIDLAKTVFQICGLSQTNKILFNRKVSRKKLLIEVLNAKPEVIVIESCYSANYWGRLFQSYKIEVKLIPPQHVKAFVKGNKNDHHDALAIAEASRRHGVHFVPVKTVEQQNIQALHRVRSRHMRNRTSLTNQMRGLLSDFGIIINVGYTNVLKTIPVIIEDATNGLPISMRELMNDMYEELTAKNIQIKKVEEQIKSLSQQQIGYQNLMTIPGIGLITSSAFMARVGNARQFSSARGMAAWLGMVPGHESSGTRMKMKSMTKRGDKYMRTLLIHCARTVVNRYQNTDDPLKQFANKVVKRRGKNIATVAVAHKLARIIWAMLSTDKPYNPEHALAQR